MGRWWMELSPWLLGLQGALGFNPTKHPRRERSQQNFQGQEHLSRVTSTFSHLSGGHGESWILIPKWGLWEQAQHSSHAALAWGNSSALQS